MTGVKAYLYTSAADVMHQIKHILRSCIRIRQIPCPLHMVRVKRIFQINDNAAALRRREQIVKPADIPIMNP